MTDVLERGNIYFVYRPKVEHTTVAGLEDVQRFFVILSPFGKACYRLLVIGRKRLPAISAEQERNWAFVQKVSSKAEDVEDELDRLTYSTATRGERHLSPARPAGEGVYAIARHDDHTHLAFALELPERPGEVQEELNIPPEGSYIITVKNPTLDLGGRPAWCGFAARGSARAAAASARSIPRPPLHTSRSTRFS